MDSRRLDGWKAIANFLGRDRTTAIRWASERGLPVHRVPGGRTGTVFAHTTELEQWLAGFSVGADSPVGDADASLPPPKAGWLRQHALKVFALMIFVVLAAIFWTLDRAKSRSIAPVSIAAIVSPSANAETVAFADAVTADLARFTDASSNLVVFERGSRRDPNAQYVVYTSINREAASITADVRLVATANREVMWSHRFVQTSTLPELRAQLAAKIIGMVRCSLDGLEGERTKAQPSEVAQIMAVCDAFDDGDIDRAVARARKLTATSPNLGVGWALRAATESSLAEQNDLRDRSSIRLSAARASKIAPNSVLTAIAKAGAAGPDASGPEALPIVEEALRQHPDHPWLLSSRSMILFNLGYVQASVAPAVASVQNDPSSLSSRDIAVRRLAAAGRLPAALMLQSENEQLWPGLPGLKETRSRLEAMRTDSDRHRTPVLENAEMRSNPYLLARLYEAQGDRTAAMRWLAKAPIKHAQMQWALLFWPDAAGLRTEPAFFEKMAKLGLVKWWIARRQWPDFCAEPRLKYKCADEAKKVNAHI